MLYTHTHTHHVYIDNTEPTETSKTFPEFPAKSSIVKNKQMERLMFYL